MHIRSATLADYERTAELFLELHMSDTPSPRERWVNTQLPRTIVAVVEGEVVGYLWYAILQSHGIVRHIATDPKARRMGIGKALMEEVRKRMLAAGLTHWSLNVKPENHTALAFYRSLGMTFEHASCSVTLRFQTFQFAEQEADVSDFTSEEDPTIEAAMHLPIGRISELRSFGGDRHFLKAVDDSGAITGVAVFDQSMPGVFPFRALDMKAASALLRRVSELALPGCDQVTVVVENSDVLKPQLLARGAELTMDFHYYTGSLQESNASERTRR